MTTAVSTKGRTPLSGVPALPSMRMSGYLLSEIGQVFGLCLGSLLILLLTGRILQLRELFLNLDLGIFELGLLFGYLSPFFLVLLIPISCMMGIFLTFLRMSTDRELVALKAGGVSLYQLMPAAVVFSLLCAGLTLVVSLWGISWGMENFRATVLDYAKTRTQLVIQPGVFNQDFPGLMVYARQVDQETGTLSDVIVEDRTRQDMTATIVAPRGNIATDPARGQILFALEEGAVYRQEGGDLSVLEFGQYAVRLDLNRLLRRLDLGEAQPKEFSWSKLRELAAQGDPEEGKEGNFLRKVHVELHKRWALPVSCLALGLFGLPLASAFGGMGRQYGVLLALGCFMVYYTLLSLGLSLGEAGAVPPAVGLWLPNGLFLVAGLVGLALAAEERTIRIAERVRHMRLPWRKPAKPDQPDKGEGR